MKRMSFLPGLLCLSLLALAGCSLKLANSQPTSLYLLTPLTQQSGTIKPASALHLGLGPVVLPAYLNRRQIITRKTDTELVAAEFDYWAEPLQDNFNRVLKENLSTLLATDNITLYPWKKETPINYQVRVEVIRFDRDVGGNSWLTARWSVEKPGGVDQAILKRLSYQRTPTDPGYAGTVVAMNATLEQLSRDIASEIVNRVRAP